MKWKNILIIILLAIIVGGGAWWMATKYKPPTITETPERGQFPKTEKLEEAEEPEEIQKPEVSEEKEEPTPLIETLFPSPYIISWMEGNSTLSLTKASLGTISAPRNLIKVYEIGNYKEGEKIHAITLYLKVKTGGDYESIRMNMRREINEEADLVKPNTQQFFFPDSGGMQASPNTTYTDQKVIFVVPEIEKEFYFAISDFYFSITAEDDKLELKREEWEAHLNEDYGIEISYPEYLFKEICEGFDGKLIVFDSTKVGAKSGCDCFGKEDCYHGLISVAVYSDEDADLETLMKPHLIEGFEQTPLIVDGEGATKLFKKDKPDEAYVYVEMLGYILEIAYRDVYGLKYLRTFNRILSNLILY